MVAMPVRCWAMAGCMRGFWGTVFKLQPAQRADCLPANMLDGMEGKLTNVKWAAIGKCAVDTALRDINDLLARGCCACLRQVANQCQIRVQPNDYMRKQLLNL